MRQRAEIDFDRGSGIEGKPDIAAECATQTHIDIGGEAIGIESEHAIDVERTDAKQRHAGLGADLDGHRVGREDEFEAPADIDRRLAGGVGGTDLQQALQH